VADSLRRVFGRAVRNRRTALGWSQEHLAHEAQLHRTYVSAVERGVRNVSIDNIERLSAALDADPAELLAAPRTGGR
jgi:transcriptional regulator with XRE-family HTH domain